MLTLSRLKYDVKTILRVFSIIAGIVLVILLLLKVGLFLKELIKPSPPKPAEAAFGKLPQIAFPQSVTNEKLTYRIDTLSGTVPGFSHLANVYVMDHPTPELLALDKANEKASSVGFEEKGIQISENIYEWRDEEKVLRMNILTNDFFIQSLISSPSSSFRDADAELKAIDVAVNFLSVMGLFHEDLDSEKTKTVLYSLENGSLKEATSLSSAQVVGVLFFQKDIDDFPIFYPEGKSTMRLNVASEGRSLKVISGEFNYQAPNLEDSSTYFIKTGEEAFAELKEGKGYVALYTPLEKEVLIKSIYLGYYMGSSDKQEFLMPVYVFEGNNFLAYVSAVKAGWIKN